MAVPALTTRRTLFGGGLALAATAALPAQAAAHAGDHDLLVLGKQFSQAHAAHDTAWDHLETVEEEAYRLAPAPEVLKPQRPMDWLAGAPSVHSRYMIDDRADLVRALEEVRALSYEPGVKECRVGRLTEIIEALDRHKTEHEAALAALGHSQACQAQEMALERLEAIEETILNAKATTIEGLKVKAAVFVAYNQPPDEDASFYDRTVWSVMTSLMEAA